jgi:hypothetical protein
VGDDMDNLTANHGGIDYIVSQVRICRKCKKIIDMQGNWQYHFDVENRIALLEHQDCNPKDKPFGYSMLSQMREHGRHVVSPKDKHDFLYGKFN